MERNVFVCGENGKSIFCLWQYLRVHAIFGCIEAGKKARTVSVAHNAQKVAFKAVVFVGKQIILKIIVQSVPHARLLCERIQKHYTR